VEWGVSEPGIVVGADVGDGVRQAPTITAKATIKLAGQSLRLRIAFLLKRKQE
jgi:hypothetical protein